MKKIMALFLSALCIFSLCTVFASAEEDIFDDYDSSELDELLGEMDMTAVMLDTAVSGYGVGI